MITLDNVSKKYQTRDKGWFTAVEPTSLHINQGEIFGLMGYSGAGKSTLLRLINLLERPDTGKVLIDNQDLTAMSEAQLRQARQNIGMVFQQFNLLSNRTVADNLLIGMHYAKASRAEQAEQIRRALQAVGLKGSERTRVNVLSGGEQQRVAIARCMLKPGNVVLADEPTGSLDRRLAHEVFGLILSMRERLGKSIVVVTHDLEIARRCDEVLDIAHPR